MKKLTYELKKETQLHRNLRTYQQEASLLLKIQFCRLKPETEGCETVLKLAGGRKLAAVQSENN